MRTPIRLQILETLYEEPRSPQSLAAELDEPRPNLSYQVKVLERLGAIELTGTRPVRGTLQHLYREVRITEQERSSNHNRKVVA